MLMTSRIFFALDRRDRHRTQTKYVEMTHNAPQNETDCCCKRETVRMTALDCCEVRVRPMANKVYTASRNLNAPLPHDVMKTAFAPDDERD